MTLYLISVLAVSAVCTAVLGKTFIPVLMSKKIGQPVKEIGPRWHKCKDGTPTMGGLFFIAGTALSLVISFFFLGCLVFPRRSSPRALLFRPGVRGRRRPRRARVTRH